MHLRISIICLIISSASARIRTGKHRSPRLIGGRDPLPGQLKYIVAIDSYKYSCGGGIIGERHVLTAAHCVHVDKNYKLLQPMKIIAGTNSAFSYNKDNVIEINVTRAILPSKFHQGGSNDIAVLELEESLDFKSNADVIQKLSLPEPMSGSSEFPTYEYELVTFAGYGYTSDDMTRKNGKNRRVLSGAGWLKVAHARITNSTFCKQFFAKAADDPMCLEVIEDPTRTRQQGTCTGDSGSPAVYDNSVLIGVNSFGIGICDDNIYPSLFTRVSSHMDFIKKAMRNDTENLVVFDA